MAKYRVERVAQQILREVTDILRREVKDPRVKDITITDVDVTGDLQQATIYYSTLLDDAETQERVEKGLEKIKGFVRSEVGQRLQIYKTPELFFKRDQSIAYGNHIDALLRQIHDNDAAKSDK